MPKVTLFERRKKMIDDATGYGTDSVSSDPIIRQNQEFKAQQAQKKQAEAQALSAGQKERERQAAKKAARKALGME